MASVPSLDKDLRKLRLDKYTPKAAKEVRDWIEEILGERLRDGDLLEALKDGLILCKLINKTVSPGVKAKPSNMPFVQRENISHFVRACQMPPLNLPDHDIFLTDDLYESKDPAQVLQCIISFSRRANAVNPSSIPTAIGGKTKANIVSPQLSGPVKFPYSRTSLESPSRDRGGSNASDSTPPVWNPLAKGSYAAGRISPTKNLDSKSPPGSVSSWSRKGDQGVTAPAWNIHQYGYMGGASQGNQGVSFGAPRQITAASPPVPSLADKERQRKEAEKELERAHLEAEEAERARLLELQAAEEKEKIAEQKRWNEETERRRQMDRERERAEEETQRLARERKSWEGDEERRFQSQPASKSNSQRPVNDLRLQGQYLSQYRAEQQNRGPNRAEEASAFDTRIEETNSLRQQQRAQEEALRETQRRIQESETLQASQRITSSNYSASPPQKENRIITPSQGSLEDDYHESERQYLQQEWQKRVHPADDHAAAPMSYTELEDENTPRRPLPSPRPLPDPSSYAPNPNRTDRYLSSNPAPVAPQVQAHRPKDYSTASEVDLENHRRQESQTKTKAGGWASKSLLEREMERERERQREWEEAQKGTAAASRDQKEGAGPGQTWDVHQYGYMGGDSQNRAGPGLGVGGARRQIIGPRPPPR